MRHILLFFNDIQKYPPLLSIIEVLLEAGNEVYMLGYCSNQSTIKRLESKGLHYKQIIIDDDLANPLLKLLRIQVFKRKGFNLLKDLYTNNSKVWIFGNRAAWVLKEIVFKYNPIIYLFEIPELRVHKKFRLFCSNKEYLKLMKHASKVVCCEFNRAVITQSYFQLKEIPLVIPNKPSISLTDIPCLSVYNKKLYSLFLGKKIILYQGIFTYPERKLEELCESINYLDDEYEIVLMGGDSSYKKHLLTKYGANKRIHFIGFVPSPYHLSITQMAHIGFLTYHAPEGDIENTLNTMFCAPNKIFEYSLFEKPMLSTCNPALQLIYDRFNVGVSVNDFRPESLALAIKLIDGNYKYYSENCKNLYLSVDIRALILSLES